MSTEARRLGKYELRERLAAGGMGEVWKALDPQLRRNVAIKLLHADLQDDPDFTVRFKREAQLVAALRHPNIVQIHDFDFATEPNTDNTTAYMVMDYVVGQTLADYIKATSRLSQFPSPSDMIYLFTAISLGLDYAHEKGVIHRDIKPANILLDQRLTTARPMGEPILTDFGIARLQQAGPSITIKGTLLGTPHYISPEQAMGQAGDHRSDLYSLGVVLYEMMAGVTPFRGDSLHAILMQHMTINPLPPSQVNPAIPPRASAVILTSLAKNPDERFSSASAMTIALAEALNVPIPHQLLRPGSAEEAAYIPRYTNYSPASPSWPSSAQSTPLMQPLAAGVTPSYVANPQVQISGPNTPGIISTPPISKKRGLGPLFIGLSILLALILVVAGVVTYATLSRSPGNTPTAATASVGQLTFVKGPQAAKGVFDQLQLDLPNIPDPGAGQGYYAWLESPCSSNENLGPHWTLPFSNHTIHTPPLRYKGFTNLFCPSPNSILVISRESTSPAPIVPTDRRYYAHVTRNSTAIFPILPCPTDPNSTVCESG